MANQPARRDTYWKRCGGCGGTGKVQRNNNNGGQTTTCGLCHGAGGKDTPVGQ